MWQQWVDGSKNFRPDISWVLVDDAVPGVVVGYVQSNEFEAYQAMTGRREAYLAKIGVRREYRGRGLATALLGHALRAYRDAGYQESSLDVDTNNPTGAFGLYERVGYEVETRKTIYELEVPALTGGAGD
jgi:ribosomal protein S18 acetylase RimI-like enzyme